MAHNCHGKFKFAVASSNSPQQIQIHHGKFKESAKSRSVDMGSVGREVKWGSKAMLGWARIGE